MLIVAILISSLAAKARLQAEAARHLERRTSVLYAMSRELATHRSVDKLTEVACRHLQAVFESQVAVSFRRTLVEWRCSGANSSSSKSIPRKPVSPNGCSIIKNAPVSAPIHCPAPPRCIFRSWHRTVLSASWPSGRTPIALAQSGTDPFARNSANQIALALERARLSEEAQQAHVQAATERMRSAILSSVSHDLRTPLSTITGAASSLLKEGDHYDGTARRQLAQAIYEEGHRLDRLLKNLIDMTRLEAGACKSRKNLTQWRKSLARRFSALNAGWNHIASRPNCRNISPWSPWTPS